jgi:hypothetical protein
MRMRAMLRAIIGLCRCHCARGARVSPTGPRGSCPLEYSGILLGESYIGIHTLEDFSAIVIYTNRPSSVIAYLVATLESANKLSGAVSEDINLVATLVRVNNHPMQTPSNNI